VFVFALLVAVTSATSFAAPARASVPETTTVTISAPRTCAPRATVTVVVTLHSALGAPVAGARVTLTRLKPSSETTVVSAITDSLGRISATISPKARVVLRARFVGTAAYAAAVSRRIAITPRVALTKPWTHNSTAYPGQWLPARGTLWPTHSKDSRSTKLYCDRLENGAWITRRIITLKTHVSGSLSKYAAKFRLPSAGTWRVRTVHDDLHHARTSSASQIIRVKEWRTQYVGRKLGGFVTSKKMVAITIDDGPNSRTLTVCDILERYGGRCTFFFTDQLLRGYMNQARTAYNRGFELANHTAHHEPLTHSYSADVAEATPARNRIFKATGFMPIWIRAMGGGIDKTGMRAVVDTGQLYINWSIDSYDSHAQYTSPDTLYHNVIGSVHKGSVILLHQTHPESIKALPRICAWLKAHGYKMVTVSELAFYSKPHDYW